MPILLCAASTAHGAVTVSVLTTPAQIAAFQSGATVQTFESVTGLPGFNINAFTSNVDTATLAGSGLLLFQLRAAGAGFMTTSGGTAPTGLFNLTGGLTGASSGTHVLAPLSIATQETCFDSTAGCFSAFEIIFEQAVQRVGFYMNRPATILLENSTVTVNEATPNISRSGASTIFSQAGIAAGFVALTSTAADINGVSIIMSGAPMFIDDLTYARAADTGGGSIPEPGALLLSSTALLALGLWRRRR